MPPPLGEVVPGCPQPGTGRGVMASEVQPTKDPGGAGRKKTPPVSRGSLSAYAVPAQ